MKKKFLALMLATAMAFSLTACADDWDEEGEYDDEYYEEDEEYEEGKDQESDTPPSTSDGVKGLSMSVSNSTGELTITRKNLSENVSDDGTWTIFIYLCGTDLESDGGMGTGDLEEMLGSKGSDNVRFIVETGGTNGWSNSDVDSDKLQRFVVQNGEQTLVDEKELANMGDKNTLTDFLTWGTKEYNSEHMGLVFWDHGGGSITGVCFDEMFDNDSIDLMELDESLMACTESMGRKFDFVGFDACLMGTVENANVLATYADYMYGSEESEPGSGWDYTAIGNFLAENPDTDAASLGKVVCDSFLQACIEQNDSDITTLSVIDLSKIDNLLKEFNSFAKNMYDAGNDSGQTADMVRAITAADNFGGNNKSEGYTNMVDMGGIIASCKDYADGADSALKALEDAVVYKVAGTTHPDATGLSMYYPLSVQGSNELAVFGKLSVSPYYVSFVDRQNKTGATDETFEEYDDDQMFDEEGDWEWGESTDDSYWDYLDDYEQTGESSYITFASEPEVDGDGYYGFTLDENGLNNAAGVCALVYETSADGENYIELGETIDINGDWDNGSFTDNFDGYWLSLPDGQNLATYIVEQTEDYVVYTSPILLNGEETNLRLKQTYDGEVTVEGAWDGIDENGCASRDIIKLSDGDVITPAYYAYGVENDEESSYTGSEFTVDGEIEIVYDLMEVGEYLYAFCIDDIYGDYYVTEYMTFNVTEDGEVTF